MDNIEYTEEEKRVVIATGALSLDDKLSEEEKRNRVFSKLDGRTSIIYVSNIVYVISLRYLL